MVAFSWYDREVGYCQGLNRLAAIALLFLDEEDSFWCLVAIVQHLLPSDYYSKALLGSQTDQRVLKELLDARWHRLSQHLAACECVSRSLLSYYYGLMKSGVANNLILSSAVGLQLCGENYLTFIQFFISQGQLFSDHLQLVPYYLCG